MNPFKLVGPSSQLLPDRLSRAAVSCRSHGEPASGPTPQPEGSFPVAEQVSPHEFAASHRGRPAADALLAFTHADLRDEQAEAISTGQPYVLRVVRVFDVAAITPGVIA
ncbi:hypothetical protein J7E99_33580 [Streptomyces sp. ISL-44]|uniref:hypothetical protein n=1 Tax=unclassified Streptomyces TaxID=2593676 RepID=UPI001BEA9831|nr:MULTISPECIES: hypothetical protein [unclassified Streptomyces]MBT2545491.1 hypothetical protein [Streptomyces sp. ISL-44]MCX5014905.1 hypothetical protein [Streptomyces sp. NBC_00555]MCX5613342.1 hypothetical protein [Streptomyces sp. NBC_00047]UUU37779.1 hypothetical protein JIW86_01990 [Streptomyces sp. NBC_00162]